MISVILVMRVSLLLALEQLSRLGLSLIEARGRDEHCRLLLGTDYSNDVEQVDEDNAEIQQYQSQSYAVNNLRFL